jgi:hypothetical protein
MGFIIDTHDEVLGLEERRESFCVCDLKRKYPSDPDYGEIKPSYTMPGVKSEHIFVACDGEIEISKEFLLKLVVFFDTMENRKRLAPVRPDESDSLTWR